MSNLPPPPPMSPMPPMPSGSGPAAAAPEHGPYSFIEAIKVCFTKFVTFKGRARRSEFWYWVLFSQLASLVVGGWSVVPNIVNVAAGGDVYRVPLASSALSNVVALVLFLPGLAVTFRRLHDVGRSGAWLVAPLVSFAVALGFLIPAIIMTLANLSDTDTVSSTAAGLWVAVAAFGILGFALYIPILITLSKDGGPNTPNKYGVRD